MRPGNAMESNQKLRTKIENAATSHDFSEISYECSNTLLYFQSLDLRIHFLTPHFQYKQFSSAQRVTILNKMLEGRELQLQTLQNICIPQVGYLSW